MYYSDGCEYGIKSENGGRCQNVLFSSNRETGTVFLPEGLKDVVATVDDKGAITNREEKAGISSKSEPGESAGEVCDIQDVIDGWANMITLKGKEGSTYELVNASLMRGSVTMAEKTYKSYVSGQETVGSIYFSYDVELAAVVEPKRNKVLKFTSVNSFVSVRKLGRDEDWSRGDGTSLGALKLYPGDRGTHDPSQVSLPNGWRIIKIAPESPNSENTYTRTTGWSIGATGGGETGKDPKVAVNLSLSYQASNQYSESFPDFTAINQSSSAYCLWEYRFTKLYRDWESLFHGILSRPEKFPALSTSTMYMKNEVVYELPADDNRLQPFMAFICQFRVNLRSQFPGFGCYYYGDSQDWLGFSINLGVVKFKV